MISRLYVESLALAGCFCFMIQCISVYTLIMMDPQSLTAYGLTLFMGIEIALIIPILMKMFFMWDRSVKLGKVF